MNIMPSIPAATLRPNIFATAIIDGRLGAIDMLPFAVNLADLLASNVGSARIMADRHTEGLFAAFYAAVLEGETEAERLLTDFVASVRRKAIASTTPAPDPEAQRYASHIRQIAEAGEPWDYVVCYLHLCQTSTAAYQALSRALCATGAFSEVDLAHFHFFGAQDSGLTAVAVNTLRNLDESERLISLEHAMHLGGFEELFWERMVALCDSRSVDVR